MIVATGTERYEWLAVERDTRTKCAHAFLAGDPHSLCLGVVRHPMAGNAWTRPGPDRRRCKRCADVVVRHPNLVEVTS